VPCGQAILIDSGGRQATTSTAAWNCSMALSSKYEQCHVQRLVSIAPPQNEMNGTSQGIISLFPGWCPHADWSRNVFSEQRKVLVD